MLWVIQSPQQDKAWGKGPVVLPLCLAGTHASQGHKLPQAQSKQASKSLEEHGTCKVSLRNQPAATDGTTERRPCKQKPWEARAESQTAQDDAALSTQPVPAALSYPATT